MHIVGTSEKEETWIIEVPKGKRIRAVVGLYESDVSAITEWMQGLKYPPQTKSEAIRVLIRQGIEKENEARV